MNQHPPSRTIALPPTALTEVSCQHETESFRYRMPMKFGGRVVEAVTVSTVRAEVVNREGQRASGLGSMTMGVAWAWPDAGVADAVKLDAVLAITRKLVDVVSTLDSLGHPIEICQRLSPHRAAIASQVQAEFGLTRPIPELAVLLAGSPIESALFDAHGKAAGRSAYALLSPPHLVADLGELLDRDRYRGLRLDQFVAPEPVSRLPMFHLVGALDPLTDADVVESVGDGLPETLGQWITRNELTHLKIKLSGDDPDWDFQRIAAIDAVATSATDRGQSDGQPWRYSLDFNERCADEEVVLTLLEQLQRHHPKTLARIEYIEQPTSRDLSSSDAITMHRVAAKIPVVIDESLTDLASLERAVQLGYSGVALKACKGHAEALLLGAVAQHERRFLCVQDLTCVGASLLHSMSLAAHLPGVAAIESNGRQYCPAGNAAWLDQFGPLMEIRGGEVPTSLLSGAGLGY